MGTCTIAASIHTVQYSVYQRCAAMAMLLLWTASHSSLAGNIPLVFSQNYCSLPAAMAAVGLAFEAIRCDPPLKGCAENQKIKLQAQIKANATASCHGCCGPAMAFEASEKVCGNQSLTTSALWKSISKVVELKKSRLSATATMT